MSIRLVVARGSGPTGAQLAALLRERGVQVVGQGGNAVVSYGVQLNTELPSLNRLAGTMDKMEQALELTRQGVETIRVLTIAEARNATPDMFPMLGRRRQHRGGTDIRYCRGAVGAALRAGSEWFTPVIPSAEELRCWIYRGRHLGTYQKVLRHPRLKPTFGRNRRNGYAFELVRSEDVQRGAVELAAEAVRALGLDFGAVDILRKTAGGFVVLEVNTAPGVEGPRQVIVALADKIVRWEQKGYPVRNGDVEARRQPHNAQ